MIKGGKGDVCLSIIQLKEGNIKINMSIFGFVDFDEGELHI